MSKIKIYTCGGTHVEGSPFEAWIETSPCDFMLEIQTLNGSKSYRLESDGKGNLIVSSIDVSSIEMMRTSSGDPALRLIGR